MVEENGKLLNKKPPNFCGTDGKKLKKSSNKKYPNPLEIEEENRKMRSIF